MLDIHHQQQDEDEDQDKSLALDDEEEEQVNIPNPHKQPQMLNEFHIQIEQALLQGLVDAHVDVRATSRQTYQVYKQYYPEAASR